MTKTIRALGLFSGGLDSMLAAAVLRAQVIEVTLVCFVTPFFGAAAGPGIGRPPKPAPQGGGPHRQISAPHL